MKTQNISRETPPSAKIQDLFQQTENQSSALRFLWLEVTNRCNLECVHCYANSGPNQPLLGAMSLSDWERLLHEAADIGCRKVQFIGGEPTLYPHLRELISRARNLDYDFIEVYTNGAGLTNPMCEFLRSNDVHVAFSLYGASPEVNDSITKRIGSYDRTVQRISAAVDTGLPTRVGVISMEENKDDVDSTVNLLKSLGVSKIGIDRVRGIGRGDGIVQATDPMKELCGACGRGRLAVDMNGDVYPCVFSKFRKIGNVREGLSDLCTKIELKSFRNEMHGLHDERSHQSGGSDECRPDRCEPLYDCNPGCLPTEPDDCMPALCRPGQ